MRVIKAIAVLIPIHCRYQYGSLAIIVFLFVEPTCPEEKYKNLHYYLEYVIAFGVCWKFDTVCGKL